MLSLGWSEKVENGGVEGEGIGVQRDSRGERKTSQRDQAASEQTLLSLSPLPLLSSPLSTPLSHSPLGLGTLITSEKQRRDSTGRRHSLVT